MSNSIPQDTPANTDKLIAKWKEVAFAIAGREVEPDERMINFIATQVRLGKIEELKSLVNIYDGQVRSAVMLDLRERIEALEQEAQNERTTQ